jgi:hypothetical protein
MPISAAILFVFTLGLLSQLIAPETLTRQAVLFKSAFEKWIRPLLNQARTRNYGIILSRNLTSLSALKSRNQMKPLFLFLAVLCTPAFSQSTHWVMETFHNPPGTPLEAGDSVSFTLPPDYPCRTLKSWGLLINPPGGSGTAAIDVWRTPYPGFPTSANSITGGAAPYVNVRHNMSTTLPSTWQTGILPNDAFVFYIKYITGGANEATLVLGCQ